jgi:hypothetical protein
MGNESMGCCAGHTDQKGRLVLLPGKEVGLKIIVTNKGTCIVISGAATDAN